MTRSRRDLEVVEDYAPPVVAGPVAYPVERSTAGHAPMVVVVREQPGIPQAVVEQGEGNGPKWLVGLAALIASVGVIVWAVNPHFYEPDQPLSGPPAHHVERSVGR